MVYRKNPTDLAVLRQMASARMNVQAGADADKLDLAQVQHLLEELEIHQIELELQNEHLNAARGQLEVALSQCNEVFDFAPFGSVMMDADGVITKLNLTAAQLLGRERARLVGSRLGLYVAESHRPQFNALLARAKARRESQASELSIQLEDLEPRPVHVKAVWIGAGTGWQLALMDVSEQQRMEAQLRASEERLALALSAVGDGAWDWQVSSGEVVLSDEFVELFGFTRKELGTHVSELTARIHLDDKPQLMAKMQDCITGKANSYAVENRVQCKDGSWKWVLSRGVAVQHDKHGQALRVIGTLVDISARKAAEGALAAAAQFQQAVFDSISSQIAVLDQSGTIVQTNMAWHRYAAGLGFADSVGRDYRVVLAELVHQQPQALQAISAGIVAVAEGDIPFFLAPEAVECEGGKRWLTIRVSPVNDEAHRMVVTHEDVSDLKRAELASLALANVDTLTGALSRQHFICLAEQELSRSLRYKLPLVVLMLDLDHFKQVNDTYGHQGGDAVLVGFVQTVKSVLRESDIIGRIGGEEFAVLLPNTTQEGGQALANRIVAEVRSSPIPLNGGQIAYTVSVGAGCLSTQTTFKQLLAQCDKELYRAKKRGRNRLEVSWENPGAK